MIIICMVLVAINSCILFGAKRNFLFVYNIWWIVWTVFSMLNFANLYVVESNTYFNFFVIFLTTNLVYVFIFRPKITKLNSIGLNYRTYVKLYLMLYILITLVFLLKMYTLLDGSAMNYWKARSIFWSVPINGEITPLFPSPLVGTLYHILSYMLQFAFLYSLYVFLLNGNKSCLLLSLFAIALYCVLSSGRNMLIMNFILILLYAFKSGNFKRIKNVLFVSFAMIFTLTIIRNGGIEVFFQSIISYFTGPFIYYQLMSETISSFSYGNVFLSQYLAPVYKYLSVFNINIPQDYIELTTQLQEHVRISDNNPYYNYYNALPSWLLFSYKDFGFFGVFIYPIMFFMLYSWFINKINYNNVDALLMVTYLEVTLLWSLFKPVFFDVSLFFVLITYYILTRFSFKKGQSQ
ncbi:oligosaccharide repeat unit polymerase [Vibrio parahaemolyticus]|nr:oligosaccharide repeat unit polymerase [Vibrio parahaemolyticus]ELB2015443.1 oligosaccharide repeat unit polymerase [Vibrio parahaemolyticus]